MKLKFKAVAVVLAAFTMFAHPAESFAGQQTCAAGTASDASYILPDSSSKYLTADDLAGLDSSQLRLARNEIYARHGRKFNDQTLQNYFNQKSWYKGTIEAADFKESMLNEYEKANIKLIQQAEDGQITIPSGTDQNSTRIKDGTYACSFASSSAKAKRDQNGLGTMDSFVAKGQRITIIASWNYFSPGQSVSMSKDNFLGDKNLTFTLNDNTRYASKGGSGSPTYYAKDEFMDKMLDLVHNPNGLGFEVHVENGVVSAMYIAS